MNTLELKYDACNSAAADDEQVCNLAGRKDVEQNVLTSREMCERLFVERVASPLDAGFYIKTYLSIISPLFANGNPARSVQEKTSNLACN